MRHSISLILCLVLTTALSGQIRWVSKNQLYKSSLPTRSTNAGACTDLDGDLVDDLAIINRGEEVIIYQSDGKHFGIKAIDKLTNVNGVWTSACADIDNNGNIDIICAGEYSPVTLLKNLGGSGSSATLNGSYYGQGSNLVDINNDGFLDYFLCHDDGPNVIYINDKMGNLGRKEIINFMENDTTDGSGNYGSEWVDVNNDNLVDLYLAKCRAGVDDATSLKRINRLYINQGNSKFVELADSFNIASGAQSWVGTFGDIDNDGDQDLLVANHYDKHELYENIEGKFFKARDHNLNANFCLQALLRDVDNDGLVDIVMAGVEGPFHYLNKGNFNFERVDDFYQGGIARSFLMGDYNDDGYLDIYGINAEPIARVGTTDDELMINVGGLNNFIKIALEGNKSNRQGVGAKINVYSSLGIQSVFVKAGESYGISNSLLSHFGLKNLTKVDSVKVYWPSGMVDIHKNLTSNRTYLIQESKCISAQVSLVDTIMYFSTQPLIVNGITGMQSFKWSNGTTTSTLNISSPGKYFLTAVDANGCKHISKPIIVRNGCFAPNEKPRIVGKPTVEICKNASLELAGSLAPKYRWNTGETTRTINVSQSGTYVCTFSDLCGNQYTDTVRTLIKDTDFKVTVDSINKGDKAILISDSKSTEWYSALNFDALVGIGDTIITLPIEASVNYFARNSIKINTNTENVGHTTLPTTDPYGGLNTNTTLDFSTYDKINIKSVLVKAEEPGTRKIVVTDFFDEVIVSKDVYIPLGVSRIDLNFVLEPKEYYSLGTDEATNIASLGKKSPRLARTIGGTSFPYVIDGVVHITGTGFGGGYYYYFYDWEVEYGYETCVSDLKEVPIIVRGPSKTNDIAQRVQTNNPVIDQLYIDNQTGAEITNIVLTNTLGANVFSMSIYTEDGLDVKSLQSGIYYLTCSVGQSTITKKIVKL